MSDPGYTFLPWVRRGAASFAASSAGANYLSVSVAASVNGTAAPAVGVRLYGPGDVRGIDARVISRREPLPDTASFEPNYLPAIEFAAPDFPWMFSPATPAGATLAPWVCLAVVRVQPGVSIVARGQDLPLLQFESPAVPLDELPDLTEIANWVHAQQSGTDGIDDAVSRILCPRALQPATAYLACLVPTYHVGAAAGITPEAARDDTDVAPAWSATTTAPFALPIYAWWRFATSDGGDFASLVERLRPPATTLALGVRDLDVSAPGFGMPEFDGLTLGLEGALVAPSAPPSTWPAGTQSAFEAAIRPILSPAPAAVPIVSPPVYGSVAAGAALPADGANPAWLRDLNLDPRRRAIAGFSSSVVATARESLVASAWDQFEAIRNANQALRQLQLGREVSASLRTRHFASVASADAFLQMVRPLHARLRLGGAAQTVQGQLAQSRVPIGAVSGALRRLSRRRGPVGRVLLAPAGSVMRIVTRLNAATGAAGALVVATPRTEPSGTVLLDSVAPAVTTSQLAPSVVTAAPGWFAAPATTATAALHVVADVETSLVPASPLAPSAPSAPIATGDPIVRTLPPIPTKGLPSAPVLPTEKAAQLEMVLRFRAAATAVTTYVNTRTTKISDAPMAPPLAADLGDVRTLALAAVDPAETMLARAKARIPAPLPATGDALRPLSVSPSFPQAMSRELAPAQLLPGIETMAPETVVLLETNAAFVEAYLVGLNDAMRRELAWRQFPCDQRSTFFAQFWSDASSAPPDIPPIATWNPANALGSNATFAASQCVLLVRGELLRRYPNAVISAVQAAPASGNAPRTLGTAQLFPTFMGTIAPDVAFFGFALTPANATAGAWYFVFSEHPEAPRFGFEPAAAPAATTWNDVGWPQLTLAHNHIALAASNPGGPLESVAWNTGAAATAFIAFRRPVRAALFASAIIA